MDAHPLAAPVDVPAPAEPIPASDRRVLPALCASAFVATVVFIAPAPFFPIMADDLDVSVPLLGQVIAAMLLLSAVIGLVVGPLADRYGNRRLIILGLLAAAVCLTIFGLAPTFPVLLAGSLAGGLADHQFQRIRATEPWPRSPTADRVADSDSSTVSAAGSLLCPVLG